MSISHAPSGPSSCAIVVGVAVGVVLATLGGVLMGTAPSTQFVAGNTQFIFGFVFMMLLAIYLVNLLLIWIFQSATYIGCYLLLANVVMVFTIVGATLVGVAPSHAFVPTNSLFIAGFTFLILMAAVVVVALISFACVWYL